MKWGDSPWEANQTSTLQMKKYSSVFWEMLYFSLLIETIYCRTVDGPWGSEKGKQLAEATVAQWDSGFSSQLWAFYGTKQQQALWD